MRDQSLKLSEVKPNFARFLPLQNFWVQAPQAWQGYSHWPQSY